MYCTISQKIVEGHPGDTTESLERASSLMLCLEDSINEKNREISDDLYKVKTIVSHPLRMLN